MIKSCLFTLLFMVSATLAMAQSDGAALYQQKKYFEAFRVLQKEAKKGNVESQYYLGRMYVEGKGVGKSIPDAVKWLNKAADQQHVNALLLLGNMYENLKSLQHKKSVAEKKYRQAVELGSTEGMAYLGNYYLSNKKETEGIAYLEKAVQKGDKQALYWLGNAYFHGIGVQTDYAKAMEYLTKAGPRNKDVAILLAIMYYKGLGCDMDWQKAKQILTPFARQRNYPAKLTALINGSVMELTKDPEHRMTFPVFSQLDDVVWIAKHVKYPVRAMEGHIQGKVELNCVIDKEGNISVKSVKSSPHDLLTKASMDVIKKMPSWIPATRGEEKIAYEMVIPVNFKLNF